MANITNSDSERFGVLYRPLTGANGILWMSSLMKRSEHRILTTHVGSLVRPKELRDLAPPGEAPKDLAQYNAVLCQQTLDVVRKQAE